MVLDMRPMLSGEVDRIDIDYMLEPDRIEGITFKGDMQVSGRITNNSGYMLLTLTASVEYAGECARCLSDVEDKFEITFERTVANEGTLSEQQIDDNVDEYAIIEKGRLDIDDQLKEEMILSFPMRLLCSEDCPGLCPKCGKPKRDGECGCPTKEIDPRWAVLKTLLDENDDGNNK